MASIRFDGFGKKLPWLSSGNKLLAAFNRTARLTIILAGIGLPTNAVAVTVPFIPLGDFTGGESFSEANGLTSDGSIVVGTGVVGMVNSSDFYEAFRWTATTGLVGLGTELSIRGTSASAISPDGSTIAGSIFDAYPNRSVFVWTEAAGMKRLEGCACAGFDSVSALTDNGNVIVGRMLKSDGYRAFRWEADAGATDLGVFQGGNESAAAAVSDDGATIVGHAQGSNGFYAFRWEASTGMVRLPGFGPNVGGGAHAITPDGSVIVGHSYHGPPSLSAEAVVWTAGNEPIGLGLLPGTTFSAATDVSADGEVIVGTSGNQAFRWTRQSGMRAIKSLLIDLGADLSGWNLTNPPSISADGRVITGLGINPEGNAEAYVAHIAPWYVPEPNSAMLACLGAVAITARCLRKKVV